MGTRTPKCNRGLGLQHITLITKVRSTRCPLEIYRICDITSFHFQYITLHILVVSIIYDITIISCVISNSELLNVDTRIQKTKYRIAQNFGRGKLWRIWRILSDSPKFYPTKNAFRKFYKSVITVHKY